MSRKSDRNQHAVTVFQPTENKRSGERLEHGAWHLSPNATQLAQTDETAWRDSLYTSSHWNVGIDEYTEQMGNNGQQAGPDYGFAGP